jgi:hypothetical protein
MQESLERQTDEEERETEKQERDRERERERARESARGCVCVSVCDSAVGVCAVWVITLLTWWFAGAGIWTAIGSARSPAGPLPN